MSDLSSESQQGVDVPGAAEDVGVNIESNEGAAQSTEGEGTAGESSSGVTPRSAGDDEVDEGASRSRAGSESSSRASENTTAVEAATAALTTAKDALLDEGARRYHCVAAEDDGVATKPDLVKSFHGDAAVAALEVHGYSGKLPLKDWQRYHLTPPSPAAPKQRSSR